VVGRDEGYYRDRGTRRFRLFDGLGAPAWRHPQLGSLGALLAHWSLPRRAPALISLPTGTGKTAVGVAAPHLVGATRVLVVVPSTELRRQMTTAFRSQEVLERIGALEGGAAPEVLEVGGRVDQWEELEGADVVVALPNSISPAHYADNPPPSSLFDVLIIDEAHHAPARTWRAILDHFDGARAVLLTATPRRRDGQRLPGDHVFHYPLRQALEEGIFKPVQPRVLEVSDGFTRDRLDALIADEVASILMDPVHGTSTALIRAANRERARALAALYEGRGIPVQVLYSGLGRTSQQRIIDGLRSGEYRAVAVVGMLVEGFDLPSLRVVAYHDKHKSLPATAQLIGRLARVDDRFPQPSVLVTARDIDVYPELQGIVRALYQEDDDWAAVLPGIIDAEIADEIANREYAQLFTPAPPELSLEAIHPIRRSIILEIPPSATWEPPFQGGQLPDELQPGRLLRGRSILYAGLNENSTTVMVVTSAVSRPRWHDDPGLDTPVYELHLVSYRQPPQTRLPGLLLFNTGDTAFVREMLRILNAKELVQPADPTRLQEAFDSLERVSVSSVGVRNTYGGGRGVPSYRIFAGSRVDRGLRDADTAFGSLGHAMVQVTAPNGAFTAGVATGKGKYWETRYAPLREYDEFLTGLAERYWFPPIPLVGQLLPQVNRGRRMAAWPAAQPIAVELDFALIGTGWTVDEVGPLEAVDLRAAPARPGPSGTRELLPLEAVALNLDGEPIVWRGQQDLLGSIQPIGDDLVVRRGFAGQRTLSDLLGERPPTIFFLDGTTVHGTTIFDSRVRSRLLPPATFQTLGWDDIDIQAETRSAAARRGVGRSVHEALEEFLVGQPRRARHRWVIGNDGPGEIADYLVVELDGTSAFTSASGMPRRRAAPIPAYGSPTSKRQLPRRSRAADG
jgi:superfamily II DNA or RNA helicase